MESKELSEYIDQHRWLLNNGLISDDVKNQLFFCGSVVHKDVRAIEVDVIADKKLVNYTLYLDKDLIDVVEKYHQLSKSTTLFGLWRFKRLLKKEGTLDFRQILNKFVVDFCGPKWSVSLTIKDFGTYVEELGVQGEKSGSGGQYNQLPDQR